MKKETRSLSQAASVHVDAANAVDAKLFESVQNGLMHYRLERRSTTAICGDKIQLPGEQHIDPTMCVGCKLVRERMISEAAQSMLRDYWSAHTAGLNLAAEPKTVPAKRIRHKQEKLPDEYLPTGTGLPMALVTSAAQPQPQARWSIPARHAEKEEFAKEATDGG